VKPNSSRQLLAPWQRAARGRIIPTAVLNRLGRHTSHAVALRPPSSLSYGGSALGSSLLILVSSSGSIE